MSTAGISANRLELLQIAKAVAEEKSIEKHIVLEAIEEAIQRAARLRYGSELDIRAKLDPVTGEMDLKRVITVVEEVENEAIYNLSMDDALKLLQQLSPSYRLVFNLFVLEGYKHPEIAEMLNISVGTSKSNLSKAKKRLQKLAIPYYGPGQNISNS